MNAVVKVVLSIDGDPDPVAAPDPDTVVLRKYHKMNRLVTEYCGGNAAITLHSSPVFRDRFFNDDYMAFWRAWVADGKDLALHLEDDLYRAPDAPSGQPSIFHRPGEACRVLAAMLDRLDAAGVACRAFRGGSNGQSPSVAGFLADRGIGVDLSCAPGLHWPERGVDWAGSPVSAYVAAPRRLNTPVADVAGGQGNLLIIPLGWDGRVPADRRRPDSHFLANESSTLSQMKDVWDAITRRAADSGETQIVSFLCHTYAVEHPAIHARLQHILAHIRQRGGRFISLRDAVDEVARHNGGGQR